MGKQDDRNINVELIRIIACCIVIGVHFKLDNFINGVPSKGRVLISCVLGDGVAIFWIIAGFFFFTSNRNILDQFKSICIKILWPSLCLVLFSQCFIQWIYGNMTFIECIFRHDFDYYSVFSNILSWTAGMTGGSHLWYVFSYVQNFLWIPLIKLVCNESDNYISKVRRYLILMSVMGICINDIQAFAILPIGRIVPYSIISTSLMQMLLGYEIYLIKEKIMAKRIFSFIGMGIFVGINIIRAILQYQLFLQDTNNMYCVFWNTGFGTCASVALVIWGMSINLKKVNTVVRKIVKYIGKRTFGIYLVHYAVGIKINSYGFGNKLYQVLKCDKTGIWGAGLYTICQILVILLSSLIVLLLLQYVRLFWRNVYKRLKTCMFSNGFIH